MFRRRQTPVMHTAAARSRIATATAQRRPQAVLYRAAAVCIPPGACDGTSSRTECVHLYDGCR